MIHDKKEYLIIFDEYGDIHVIRLTKKMDAILESYFDRSLDTMDFVRDHLEDLGFDPGINTDALTIFAQYGRPEIHRRTK